VWVRPTARRGPYGDARTGWRDRRGSSCGCGSRAYDCGAGCSAGTCACSWDSPGALCRRTPSGARERPLRSATRLLYAAGHPRANRVQSGPPRTSADPAEMVPVTSRRTPRKVTFCAATSANAGRTPGDTPSSRELTHDEVARAATGPLGFSTIAHPMDPQLSQDHPQAE
jgi:hypothetical protein